MPIGSRHRLAKSQGSDCELVTTDARPISLVTRPNASRSRRCHTTSSFANDLLCLSPPDADVRHSITSSGQPPRTSQRATMRMHSDSDATAYSNNCRIRMSGDVWSAAVPHANDGKLLFTGLLYYRIFDAQFQPYSICS